MAAIAPAFNKSEPPVGGQVDGLFETGSGTLPFVECPPATQHTSGTGDASRLCGPFSDKLAEDGRLLRQFVAHLDAVGAEHLIIGHALAWARQPQDGAPAWRAVRLGTVRSFARQLSALDPVREVLTVGLLPEASHRTVLDINSDEDIALLLGAGPATLTMDVRP